jgi:hypothetical protein
VRPVLTVKQARAGRAGTHRRPHARPDPKERALLVSTGPVAALLCWHDQVSGSVESPSGCRSSGVCERVGGRAPLP